MQSGFRRHLCNKILGKKQSKENVALGWASPRTSVIVAGGRQWSQARPRGGNGQPEPAGPWPPGFASSVFAWSLILPVSFCLVFTLDSVSERAGWAVQMSHSLSLDVMEMAEVAALLDRLAAGLAAAPSTSGVPSSSALRARPEPCDMTCCWSLREGKGYQSQRVT